MNAPPKFHPLEAAALAALFAAAISLPLVKQLAFGEPDTSAIEKRVPAPAPDFSGNWKRRIKFLPAQFDAYYGDHFGFRYLLVEAGSLIGVKWFGISGHAMIGKNGWLFYKLDPPIFSRTLSSGDLAKWKSYLEHRQQWLAARGIKYLFVVPPDKDSIYPEFLPLTSAPVPRELPVDQLVRYLRDTGSSVDILPLKEPLLAAKALEQEPLYYKQDGHWNSLGGYYGYEAIVQHLEKSLPSLKAKSRGDYRLVSETEDRRDIVQLAGLANFTALQGPALEPLAPGQAQTTDLQLTGFANPPFMTQIQGPSSLPRAVMVRDSFARALAPYLSESFSRITYFSPALNSPADEKIIADTILKDKPDIFIEERVQRFVSSVPDEAVIFGGSVQANATVQNP